MIRTILVVGLGTMGRQIIDRISSPIFNILVYDNNKDLFKPHYLFEKMVKYNKLGKKSGEGFYVW